MPTRLEWLQFFIARPTLYPELWRRTTVLMKGRSQREQKQESSRTEATAWCAARAVSTREGIRRITRNDTPASVEQRFPDELGAARRAEENCPVPMGGAGNLDLLFNLAEYLAAERVVETGVAYGWSSLALLLSLRQRPAARLASVDMPYPGRGNDRYVGCVVPTDLHAQWTLIRRADRQGLPMALEALGSLDLCHYDSDKSYAGRMWAYPLLWQHLRPGGLFISDDVNDNFGFTDFCDSIGLEPVVIEMPSSHRGRKFVGVLRKPPG